MIDGRIETEPRPLPVKCSCGNTLGAIDADGWDVRHRGRRVQFDRAERLRIQCEKCGRTLLVPM